MRTCAASLVTIFLLLHGPWVYAQPTATLSGTVKSLDGSSLPRADVMLKPYTDNLFYSSQSVKVKADDSFQISVPKSGVYRLTVTGVMHKDLHVPVWIRQPDTLHLDISLDPKNLDKGEYFSSNEYISWIRVTGNFNGYNYDRGIRFDRVAPKTLRAKINTSLDTLYYQIVGLTSGTTVLPGAADYRLRDSQNYEASVPVESDKVELTYKADSAYFDNKNPFKGYRTTWDFNQSEIQFADQTEEQIHENLMRLNLFSRSFSYKMFDSDTLSRDVFEYTMEQHYREMWKLNITEIKTMERLLENLSKDADGHLKQSMFYKYLILCENILDTHDSGLLEDMETDPIRYVDKDILYASMETITPDSPLWSLQTELMLTLPAFLGFSNRVISYLEEAVMKHPDNDITGRVLYRLFTHSYDNSGRSEKTQEYYGLILDIFGDNYFARKAREHVEANN